MIVENWRRNLAAIWIAQVLSSIGFSFVFPFMPLYVQELGVHGVAEAAQWAGVITAASAISMTFAQPIWGNLADRRGRKGMLIRSMVGGGIIISLMGLAQSPVQLVILRFVQGSITGVAAASNALIATSTPKHRLGFALGLQQVAMFAGASLGPLVGGIAVDTFGYRISFYGAGLFLLLGGIIAIAFVRENFVPPPAGEKRPGLWAESRSLLAISVFPILISVVFLIQLAAMIVSPVLSLFIADLSENENVATLAGMIFAVTGLVSAMSAVFLGRIGDRIGSTVVLPVCLLGAAVAYVPQTFVQQVWQLFLLRAVLALFLGGLMPSANALVASVIPQARRGSAFGLTAMASAAAFAVGPLSGAAIATHLGMRAVFLTTGILFIMALAWVSMGFRRFDLTHAEPEPDLDRI